MESRDLHPELSPDERRRLFLRGIELFNRAEFFESHELWEEIWRSTTPEPRDLFQGLIQIAAGMHHFLDRRNPSPARRVLAKGRGRLEAFLPTSLGLDLESLLEAVRLWEDWLLDPQGDQPSLPRLRVVEEEQLV